MDILASFFVVSVILSTVLSSSLDSALEVSAAALVSAADADSFVEAFLTQIE